MTDSERIRNRVVHGWAFGNLPESTKEDIRKYLATGDPSTLPDTYKKIRKVVLPYNCKPE